MRLTIIVSLIVTGINAVMGTLIAWVLVRDRFRGKGVVNSLIDLPFALPDDRRRPDAAGALRPARAGRHQHRVHQGRHRGGAAAGDAALRGAGGAAGAAGGSTARWSRRPPRSGAGPFTIFRRIIFPNLLPAVIGGCGLAFSRALGEFGSLVLITGNIPFDDQVASFYIYSQIESDNRDGGRGGRRCSCSCCRWPPC